jgi:hypothetical protein
MPGTGYRLGQRKPELALRHEMKSSGGADRVTVPGGTRPAARSLRKGGDKSAPAQGFTA